MKKIICRDMGGECELEIEAETPKEMVKKCMERLRAVHPEMAQEIHRVDESGWKEMVKNKWQTLPEV